MRQLKHGLPGLKPALVTDAATSWRATNAGMCGRLNFAADPAPGVAVVPPVGVQWKATSVTAPVPRLNQL